MPPAKKSVKTAAKPSGKPATKRPAAKAFDKPKAATEFTSHDSIPGLVMQGLREDFSKNDNVIFISDYQQSDPISGWVSTGSFMLDAAIGFPNGLGFPFPAIVEVVGKESSGKSIVGYTVMGNFQRMGGWGHLEDVENMFSLDYARLGKLSLSPNVFGYSQSACLEDGLQILQRVAERSFALAPDLPLCELYDSVAGSTVEAEQEIAIGEKGVARAVHARILARALRSGLVPLLYTKVGKGGQQQLIGRPILIIFNNQLKSAMSHIPGQMDSFGGLALKYHSRVRVQIERKHELKDTDKSLPPYGIRCEAKVIKNKVAPPYRTVEFDIRFSSGIEDYFPVFNFLDKYEAIEKSGNYYVWKGKKRFPNDFRDFLAQHPADWEELKQHTLTVMGQMWRDQHFVVGQPPAAVEDESGLELAEGVE